MKQYSSILFDLDDTLIDNDESMKHAIFEIYDRLGIPCNEETFSYWKKYDIDYWTNWENGLIEIPDWASSQHMRIDYLRSYRFASFFRDFNITYEEAEKMNRLYSNLLAKNVVPIDGAIDLVENLSSRYELIISTNGDKQAAFAKLKAINIYSHFNMIIASGECGFSKPMPGFYHYTISRMKNKDRYKMLIIGDSLKTDVLGGVINGIDTCWFNPLKKENTSGLEPTYEIHYLRQLKKKL